MSEHEANVALYQRVKEIVTIFETGCSVGGQLEGKPTDCVECTAAFADALRSAVDGASRSGLTLIAHGEVTDHGGGGSSTSGH